MSETFEATPNTTTTARQEFARVVAPLEHKAGRRLGNRYRRICFEAFLRFPEGVRVVARTSLEDADVNPLGLFFWRIKNGWHELEPVEPTAPAVPGAPIADTTLTPSSAQVVSTTPGLAQWLRNTGAEYAESPTDFRAELEQTFKITEAELVRSLRQIALGNDDEARS